MTSIYSLVPAPPGADSLNLELPSEQPALGSRSDTEPRTTFVATGLIVIPEPEGKFSFIFENQNVDPDYIPLDTQIDVIADTYIWPTVDDLARKSDAGESMSKSDRQASLALELLGRAASRIRLGQYGYDGDKGTAQTKWLESARTWFTVNGGATQSLAAYMPDHITTSISECSDSRPPSSVK